MSNPVLVTVVTVCRNVKSSLEKTMNSLLHQSYAHIDYVIIDGASTDGTPEDAWKNGRYPLDIRA